MADYRYKVSITKQAEPGLFRVAWLDMEKGTENSFGVSASKIIEMSENRLKSWKKPENRLAAGKELFDFLDGSPRYFSNLLDAASAGKFSPLVYLTACRETEDWPFESMAQGERFLVPTALNLVRCASERGAKTKPAPKNRPLKMLFMACSALGVEPELSFEKEEETIFKVTEALAVDIEVEDSGSLEGLKGKLALEKYDIVHLSGHAGIDDEGQAFFVMEDEAGNPRYVTASELYHEALIDNMPRMVFLSGCHTGETVEKAAGTETVSFCRELVEEYEVPVVLGWGRAVGDEDATHAAQVIYRELSRGKSVLEAVRRARYDMIHQTSHGLAGDWLLLRLFGDMTPLSALVKEGQKRKPKHRELIHTDLRNSRVKVLKEGFVGRRRPLQRSIGALNNNRDKVGVLILGAGGLGKSCLAGKICERYSGHQLIIVHGVFNAVTFEEALREGFETARDKEGLAVLDEKIELTKKLSELCVTSFREGNYFIVLDDFEQNLEGGTKEELTKAFAGGPGGRFSRKAPPCEQSFRLTPEAAQLMMVLLQWLPKSGKMTQLIITGRYGFELEYKGVDLVLERLERVYLASFLAAEQEKKLLELRYISRVPVEVVRQRVIAAGCGNPRLLEWLDKLVEESRKEEVALLLEKVKGKKEEFIREHVLRELLRKGGAEFGRLMVWLSIYRRPVLKEGVKAVAGKLGMTTWEGLLARGVEFSVVEYYAIDSSYGVTPLLREELEGENKDCEMCHRAGMEYYSGLKAERKIEKVYDPVLVEELIYHALGCGEEEIAAGEGGRLVFYLTERLAFRESQRVGEWVLCEKKAKLSSGNDGTLLNNLGYLHWTLGDQGKAIGYYEQALAIWKKVHGPEHPQVATSLNNLGLAYKALGELRKAIKYYEQALAIDEKVYVQEHPSVARELNNLGEAFRTMGETRKAIGYYEQALAISEKVYGPEHSQVAIGLNNLGASYDDLGEKEKAIDYYEQALVIWEKVYGEEHPQVAIGLNNLGSAYFELGQKDRARPYFEKALAIFTHFYGPEHPNSKMVKSSLKIVNDEGKRWKVRR